MNLVKTILIALGTLSLCIGIIGIIVPGLPTTPFILLTAGLYLRSSDNLYQKLVSNRIIGSYISNFRASKGMTKRAKILALGIMWLMIAISCLFFITPLTLKLLVTAIGLTGSYVMGFIVPTV